MIDLWTLFFGWLAGIGCCLLALLGRDLWLYRKTNNRPPRAADVVDLNELRAERERRRKGLRR